MSQKRIIYLVIIGAMLLVAGILTLGDLGNKDTALEKTSTVNSVQPFIEQNGVTVVIKGNRQSCDSITSFEQKRSNDLISITPVFQRASDMACDQEIPFEEAVAIAVGGLDAGTYRIDVLGVTASIVLDAPIVPFAFNTFSENTFKQFPIAITQTITKAPVSDVDVGEFVDVQQLPAMWDKAQVMFADQLTILTISCGNQCFRHAVVDITTGTLIQTFNSSFGVEARPGSGLLIVNSLNAIAASQTQDAVIVEAYVYQPEIKTFRFIAQGDYLLGQIH